MTFLLLNQAVLPPGLQAFTGLDNVMVQMVAISDENCVTNRSGR
jgi:hypothetical protein